VTLIALLIAILLPALRQARTAARLVVCASNQRQIVTANVTYATDNHARLMSSVANPWGGTGRNVPLIRADADADDGEWNLHRINPYLNGFDIEARRSRGVLLCPSVSTEHYQELAELHWNGSSADASVNDFSQLPYSYAAGVEQWTLSEARNGAEDDLALGRISGGSRVLVFDSLLLDTKTNLFRYNHGRNDWAWNWPPLNHYGAFEDPGPPQITGINRGFTDGSVQWKDAGQFALDQMLNPAAYPDGWINRGGDNPTFY